MSDVPTKTDRESSDPISIGRIPLKKVRVSRSEPIATAAPNPMNRLVPYLDLFDRLRDDELSRLAAVDVSVASALREQFVAICSALVPYVDLLERLGDEELARLTNASPKTIRFWRLCQPRGARAQAPQRGRRGASGGAPAPTASEASGASSVAGEDGGSAADSQPAGNIHDVDRSTADTAPYPAVHRTPDVSKYMEFSGEPFPGFDEPGDEAARASSPLGGGDLDDPLRGL